MTSKIYSKIENDIDNIDVAYIENLISKMLEKYSMFGEMEVVNG